VEAIEKEFHSFEAMRNVLSTAAVAIKVVFAFLFFCYLKTSTKYQHIILSSPSDINDLLYSSNWVTDFNLIPVFGCVAIISSLRWFFCFNTGIFLPQFFLFYNLLMNE
jgi:hypothetical protein